ncbi:MAG: DUF3047 domain-containing protein [Gammaproteobacteria bacterium]|nr:DUF3047 domain-containing protein [Gammaproteobacteria bacterium]
MVAILLGLAVTPVIAGSDRLPIGAFSTLGKGGETVDGWRVTELPSVESARIERVRENGAGVVAIAANNAASSLVRDITWDLSAYPNLLWRWRVSRVISAGDVTVKSGDDFAARLYVTFDVPAERLSLFDRTKLKIARWIYGDDVPAAAICYVWGNREPVGTNVWSAYTDRVRVIVLRNADDDVGNWVDERRNVAEDYRQAFGEQPARPNGVVIAADTDQTGESVTAWFGDISAAF